MQRTHLAYSAYLSGVLLAVLAVGPGCEPPSDAIALDAAPPDAATIDAGDPMAVDATFDAANPEAMSVTTHIVSGDAFAQPPDDKAFPLADVRVRLLDEDEMTVAEAVSEPDGRWIMRAPPAEYTLCWSAPGGELTCRPDVRLDGDRGEQPLLLPLQPGDAWGQIAYANGTPCVHQLPEFELAVESTLALSERVPVRANYQGRYAAFGLNGVHPATFSCGSQQLDVELQPGNPRDYVFDNAPPVVSLIPRIGENLVIAARSGERVELAIQFDDRDGHLAGQRWVMPENAPFEFDPESLSFIMPPRDATNSDRVAVRGLFWDDQQGYAAAQATVRFEGEPIQVHGAIFGPDGPLDDATILAGDDVWTAEKTGEFAISLPAGERIALLIDAPGFVPKVVDVSDTVELVRVELTPCTPVVFNGADGGTLHLPDQPDRLQVDLPPGALVDSLGRVVARDAVACIAWFDGPESAENFGWTHVDPQTDVLGAVEPTGVGFVRYHALDDPTQTYLVRDDLEMRPRMIVGGRALEGRAGQRSVGLSFDPTSRGWRVDGEGDVDRAERLVGPTRPDGPWEAMGPGLTSELPDIAETHITGCVTVILRSPGLASRQVEMRVFDDNDDVIYQQTRWLTPGIHRWVGLPRDRRARVDLNFGLPGGWRNRVEVPTTGKTSLLFGRSSLRYQAEACSAQAVLPQLDLQADEGVRGLYATFADENRAYRAAIAEPWREVTDWMRAHGWQDAMGRLTKNPDDIRDADFVFWARKPLNGYRAVYARMDGPPGDADIAFVVRNWGGHNGDVNFTAASYRRLAAGQPRVVRMYWFGKYHLPIFQTWWTGTKSVPGACMTCHSSDPNAAYQPYGDVGFTLNPFNTSVMAFGGPNITFPQTPTRANQEEAIRRLNEILLSTNLKQPARDLILGQYGVNNPAALTIPAGRIQNEQWTPPGWAGREALYHGVVGPNCRTCHMSRRTPFNSWNEFKAHAPSIEFRVCQERSMPPVEMAYTRFLYDTSPNAPVLLGQEMMGINGWSTPVCPPF